MGANTTMSRAEVEAGIKETLGLVPRFFSAIPDELRSGIINAWDRA